MENKLERLRVDIELDDDFSNLDLFCAVHFISEFEEGEAFGGEANDSSVQNSFARLMKVMAKKGYLKKEEIEYIVTGWLCGEVRHG